MDEHKKIEIREQAIAAWNRVQQLESEGYRIIYIDEMCVTKSTIPTHEYSNKYKPLMIDMKQFSK